MLFLKRLLTAVVLLGLLFVVLDKVALAVGGGIMGAQAGAAAQQQQQREPGVPTASAQESFNKGMQVGLEAGIKFRHEYGKNMGLAALGVATVAALWLSFGGVLPWCREVKPPPLRDSPYYPQQSR